MHTLATNKLQSNSAIFLRQPGMDNPACQTTPFIFRAKAPILI